jgi:hypothetical protein
VVLPIEPVGTRYALLAAEEAWGKGYLHLARWVRAAQAGWQKRRGEKAKQEELSEIDEWVEPLLHANE